MDDKSKCRGEPVYQVNMKGCGWEDCSLDRYESAGRAMEQDAKKGLKRWQRRILWSAPQPAEPVKMRPETDSEHIARDIREGRFPEKSDRKMVPAEPVKVLSDAEIREVFLANGFTIKDGHDDLKPYVYAAARALLRLASNLTK